MSLQGVKKHRVRVIGLSVNSSCIGRNIAIYLEITTCDLSYSLVAISSIFPLILESFQASPTTVKQVQLQNVYTHSSD